MFYELIHVALGQREKLSRSPSDEEWAEYEILGLYEKLWIYEPDERIGRIILKEIEEGGNFGHYDQRYSFRKNGLLARGITDSYRLMKLAYYFPEDALWKIVRKVENQRWKMWS